MTTPTIIATALYGPPKTLPTRAERPGETPCAFDPDPQGYCRACGLPLSLHDAQDADEGGKARG